MKTDAHSPRPRPVHDPEALIASELRRKEAVIWTGRPVPCHAMWAGVPGSNWLVRGPLLVLITAALSVFALPGAAFSWKAFELLVSPTGVGSVVLALALLPITTALALAPYYLVGVRPRLRALRDARDQHYVITNERTLILLIRDGAIEDRTVHELHKLTEVRLRWLRSDGSGDVLYDRDGYVATGGDTPYTVLWDVGFFGVPDAEHAFDTLLAAIRDCPRNRSSKGRQRFESLLVT